MQINSISYNPNSLTCNRKFNVAKNINKIEFGEKEEEKNHKKDSLTAKKWGVGIASGLITGLGQLINGEVAKGLTMFGSAVGLVTIMKLAKRKKPLISSICWIAGTSLGIYSIVDAVKGVDKKQSK